MYVIEQKPFGVKLTFSGFMQKEEMLNWYNESKQKLNSANTAFGVLVDMRKLSPLLPDAQAVMEMGQKFYKEKGMLRSAVILDNALTRMQFIRIAKQSGIYEWERYIDASADPNWESTALKWIENEQDPDA